MTFCAPYMLNAVKSPVHLNIEDGLSFLNALLSILYFSSLSAFCFKPYLMYESLSQPLCSLWSLGPGTKVFTVTR